MRFRVGSILVEVGVNESPPLVPFVGTGSLMYMVVVEVIVRNVAGRLTDNVSESVTS